MEAEAIEIFLGKQVKLEFHNGFNLRGTIKNLFKDTIFFETKQTSSLINTNEIKNIILITTGKLYD